ncbi:zinc-binding alcohol dehydrogenase family protein [Agreia sp.]|uniref:quinone oxidoreductase family protein n=1 Tax=Agreia sp. TaxID=1872416 RepID=UPI0035BC47A5
MKAVQISEYGSPEVLTVVDLPVPTPGPGQILVKVEAAGVNFSDVTRRRNDPYPDATPLPFVLGGEVAGTVTARGEGVDEPALGSVVFGLAGVGGEGGYAEYALMSAAGAILVPPTVQVNEAAALIVTGLSALVLLREAARLEAGDVLFVPAASGGFGSYAVQFGKLLGATVIGAASTQEKRQAAMENGADFVIDSRSTGWADEVRRLTDGRGADVVLEMTSPAHLTQSIRALAPFGRLITYGAVAGRGSEVSGAALEPLLYDPAPGQMIAGFNLGQWFAHRYPVVIQALQDLVSWAGAGSITVPPVQEFDLADAAAAHRLLESGASTGKLVLRPRHRHDGSGTLGAQ